ncbi:aminotransferase [Amycolatopsis nivea]
MRTRAATRSQIDSPISSAYDLLRFRAGERALLDLAQAAPPYPPAEQVTEHVARAAAAPDGGEYTEVPGLPGLREAFAAELTRDYPGEVSPEQVVVTAGCNQAFCVAVSALAGPGDEVVLALPFYFNHDMWLRLNEIRPVYLEPGDGFVPRAAGAERLITRRTRAIVLVTPGNPSGATVPPEGIAEFADLARRHGIALVVDETYRSFRDSDGAAHALFGEPDWTGTVVSLHSFSKELALPGYRVGAIVASAEFNRQACKLLDCVAVCAPRLGQEAALAGLTAAAGWRRDRAKEIACRQDAFAAVMAGRPGGFRLCSAGGFFGWVRHPFADRPTEDVVRELVMRHDILVVPGTAFLPDDRGMLRVSCSNLDPADAGELAARLRRAGRG